MDQETGLELIKLLLQVVFADDVVSDAERAVMNGAAKRLAGQAGVDLVEAVLERGETLPPPHMGKLVAHRAQVLREVAHIGAVDGVHKDELDMVAVIGGMLR